MTNGCPTFHWVGTPEASRNELVVFSADGVGPTELYRVELPGGAQMWTPTIERCLESGKLYAWTLGAVVKEGGELWSEAALFEIVGQPSDVVAEGGVGTDAETPQLDSLPIRQKSPGTPSTSQAPTQRISEVTTVTMAPQGQPRTSDPEQPPAVPFSIDSLTGFVTGKFFHASGWFNPSYTRETVFGVETFTADLPAPEVTQAILDSGMVLVFAKLEGYTADFWATGKVGQLPIIVKYASGETLYVDSWSARLSPGAVTIRMTNNENLYLALGGDYKFRYVVIPGS